MRFLLASMMAAVLGSLACATAQTPSDKPAAPAASAAQTADAKPKPILAAAPTDMVVDPDTTPVYFEFDSDTLSPAARTRLDDLATYLTSNQGEAVVIEGHCDERGTTEYNMALGDRRAAVTRDYLVRKGVAGDRLKIISFGEARPAVAGQDELAFGKNRRGEFVLSRSVAAYGSR